MIQTDPTGHTVMYTRDAVGRITAVDLTFPDVTTEAMPSAIPSRADGLRTAPPAVTGSLRSAPTTSRAEIKRSKISEPFDFALCGGLLADAYLGQPEPRGAALATVSLRKYKQMVDAWGGWELFQELLGISARRIVLPCNARG